MPLNTSDRVGKHRAGLRAAGFCPVQLWVPDTSTPEFAAECQRQSALAANSDRADDGLMHFLDAAFTHQSK